MAVLAWPPRPTYGNRGYFWPLLTGWAVSPLRPLLAAPQRLGGVCDGAAGLCPRIPARESFPASPGMGDSILWSPLGFPVLGGVYSVWKNPSTAAPAKPGPGSSAHPVQGLGLPPRLPPKPPLHCSHPLQAGLQAGKRGFGSILMKPAFHFHDNPGEGGQELWNTQEELANTGSCCRGRKRFPGRDNPH